MARVSTRAAVPPNVWSPTGTCTEIQGGHAALPPFQRRHRVQRESWPSLPMFEPPLPRSQSPREKPLDQLLIESALLVCRAAPPGRTRAHPSLGTGAGPPSLPSSPAPGLRATPDRAGRQAGHAVAPRSRPTVPTHKRALPRSPGSILCRPLVLLRLVPTLESFWLVLGPADALSSGGDLLDVTLVLPTVLRSATPQPHSVHRLETARVMTCAWQPARTANSPCAGPPVSIALQRRSGVGSLAPAP